MRSEGRVNSRGRGLRRRGRRSFYGRATAGRAPLYDLSYFGAHNDLGGYAAGEFVDKMILATQLEFRWRF